MKKLPFCYQIQLETMIFYVSGSVYEVNEADNLSLKSIRCIVDQSFVIMEFTDDLKEILTLSGMSLILEEFGLWRKL